MRIVCTIFVLVAAFSYFDLSGAVLTLQSAGRIETCPNNLTVYCNLTDFKKIPDAAALVSLVLARKDNETQSVIDLVSINAFSGQITSHEKINATFEGKLDPDGISYLRINYESPAPETITEYVCEAHAITMFGRPVKVSERAQVAELKPGAVQVAGNTAVGSGKPSNASLEILSGYMFLRQKEDNLNLSLTTSFAESGSYKDHKYLLSKSKVDVDVAWLLCSNEGGYLVELNTKDEYDFVKAFLQSENLSFDDYATGAVYRNTTYQFLRNPKDNKYIDLKGSESGGANKCLGLRKSMSYEMYGIKCTDKSFVCELPLSSSV